VLSAVPRLARAQGPALELHIDDLHAIAVDFEQGLNPIYCYFGARVERPAPYVRVDSVSVVASPAGCAGIGVGFFVRVKDRLLLAGAVRGVIETNPRLVVVTAFYETEDIEDGGVRVRGARGFSALRATATVVNQSGD
jgi:hypothetical protein